MIGEVEAIAEGNVMAKQEKYFTKSSFIFFNVGLLLSSCLSAELIGEDDLIREQTLLKTPSEDMVVKEKPTYRVEKTKTEIKWEENNNPWDNVPKDSNRINVKKGFEVPGGSARNRTWILIGGMVKMDSVRNFKQFTTISFDAPNIVPDGGQTIKGTNGNLQFSARQTNIFLAALKETRIGNLRGYIQFDFAGLNLGSATLNRQYTSLYSVIPRLREAYVEFGNFLVGQTATTFSDKEANGYTLMQNGVTGHSQLRLPMFRYTMQTNDPTKGKCEDVNYKLMMALEAASTDYTEYFGNTVTTTDRINRRRAFILENIGSNFNADRDYFRPDLSSMGSRGISLLPNFVAQFRIDKKNVGHVAFRALARYLSIRPRSWEQYTVDGSFAYVDTITRPEGGGNLTLRETQPIITPVENVHAARNFNNFNAFGWGAGLSGRLFIGKYTSIFAHYSGGKGIGGYIFDAPGSAMSFNRDVNGGAAYTQFAHGLLFGIEHYWSDHVRSNLIFGYTSINHAKFLDDAANTNDTSVPPVFTEKGQTLFDPKGRTYRRPSSNLHGTNRADLDPFQHLDDVISLTKSIKQVTANIIYKPVAALEMGLEYTFARRTTLAKRSGDAHRLQVSVIYRF